MKTLSLILAFAVAAGLALASNVSTNIVLNSTNDTVVATGGWDSLDVYWTNAAMRVQFDATTSASSPLLAPATSVLHYRGQQTPEIHMANSAANVTNSVTVFGVQK